jgi:hypothetical protein
MYKDRGIFLLYKHEVFIATEVCNGAFEGHRQKMAGLNIAQRVDRPQCSQRGRLRRTPGNGSPSKNNRNCENQPLHPRIQQNWCCVIWLLSACIGSARQESSGQSPGVKEAALPEHNIFSADEAKLFISYERSSAENSTFRFLSDRVPG